MTTAIIIIILLIAYIIYINSDNARKQQIDFQANLKAIEKNKERELLAQEELKQLEASLIEKYEKKINSNNLSTESFKKKLSYDFENQKKQLEEQYSKMIADHNNHFILLQNQLEKQKEKMTLEYNHKQEELIKEKEQLEIVKSQINETSKNLSKSLIEKHRLNEELQLQKAMLKEKDTALKQLRDDCYILNTSLQSKVQDIPILAEYLADIKSSRLELIAVQLETKKPPAQVAASQVRSLKRECKSLYTILKSYEYKLRYYLKVVPWLDELDDEPLNTTTQPEYFNKTYDNNNDAAGYWLTNNEYAALQDTEKYQLALDRYSKRNKSNSEIGRDFERYVGYTYEKAGYDVEYRGIIDGFEDRGRDLICKKDGVTLVIQCKYWAKRKLIHEKHINQLFGTTVKYYFEQNPDATLQDYSNAVFWGTIKPIFITSTSLSEVAKKFASALDIEIKENFELKPYPLIKCNISSQTDEKIYHLPFDQQYDKIKIDRPGECYAMTIKEAEEKGFRRAKRWFGH